MAPFVGSIVAILGLFALAVVLSVAVIRPIGEGLGRGIGQAIWDGLREALPIWSADLPADLDIAPGAPGYLGTLEMAGGQFHFHRKTSDVTRIAVEAFVAGEKVRVGVREYDGPPTTTVTSDRTRPVALLLPLVVVRTAAPEVRCRDGASPEGGQTYPVEGGALNLLTLGTVALWIGDGPRHEIEVSKDETIWCTLGPEVLAIDRREKR